MVELRDRESERERENPKAETPAVKCEVRRPPPVHCQTVPHRTASRLLVAAAAAARTRHAPFARSGSALRSGTFFFFSFFSSLILFL
jgi:hypothetical protein